MQFTTERIGFSETNYFSKIINDFISANTLLQPLVQDFVNFENLEKQINLKSETEIDRVALVNALKESYSNVNLTEQENVNIECLILPNTFTITTAHQPNIFTGHLYFIYKIAHTIKLAAELKNKFSNYNFVPIFYMGSEDADLEELGHINIDGEKWEWKTQQTGAVGRMLIDENFILLLQKIKGRFANEQFGNEITSALQECYTLQKTLQQATLEFVHFLFGKYGLLTLIADNKILKQNFIPILKDEILNQKSDEAVKKTSNILLQNYKVQAHSRAINIFYLKDNIRERIEKMEDGNFEVINTSIRFSEAELIFEIENFPERFSPNVILRGLFQEMILPNIAFIGGGGEIAYWLQLKNVFEVNNILFPILVLRNSFLLQTKQQLITWIQLGFNTKELFENINTLENSYTKRITTNNLSSKEALKDFENIYFSLKEKATNIDVTLTKHIAALQAKHLKRIAQLDAKFLRAEKRKHSEQLQHLRKIKLQLFPNNSLQERYENIIPYFAKYGANFIEIIMDASLTLEQEFVVLTLT